MAATSFLTSIRTNKTSAEILQDEQSAKILDGDSRASSSHTQRSPATSTSSSSDDEKMKAIFEARFQSPAISKQVFVFFQKTGSLEYIGVLGKGSYGKVLLVKNRIWGEVALKLVQYQVAIFKPNTFQILESRKGGEALALGLRGHPNLVETLGLLTINPERKIELLTDPEMLPKALGSTIIGVFSSYVPSTELFQILERKQASGQEFSLSEIKRIGRHIASALDFMHKKSMIHRDVKPENILLDTKGNARLLDFGFSKLLGGLGERKGTLCGSPEYMAPEIYLDNPYNQKADSFSLGAVLFTLAFQKMLTAKSYSETHRKLSLYYRGKRTWRSELTIDDFRFSPYRDAVFKDLLDKLLEGNPQFRISMNEALQHPFLKEEEEEGIDLSNKSSTHKKSI